MSGSADCFQYLLGQVAFWIREVEEVEKRIAEKQAEIAQLLPSTSRPKLKKSGSSESIRPGREEEEAFHHEESYTPTSGSRGSQSPILQKEVVLGGTKADAASAPAGLQDRTSTGQSRVVIRKRKPSSIMSSATAPLKYRSRSAIIVEYDAKVQTAFNQLVQNISSGRNRIRKARMEVQMKSLAVPADDGEGGIGERLGPMPIMPGRRTAVRSLDSTPPTFRSSRRMGPAVSPSLKADGVVGPEKQPAPTTSEDAFGRADKYLEEAQSHCERGAHQFLRDGDCEEHTEGAKQNFVDLKTLCDTELPMLRKASEDESPMGHRGRQPSLPREALADGSVDLAPSKRSVATGQLLLMEGTIEADDEDDDDNDDDDDDDTQFELSTAPMSRCRVMART